MTEHLDLNILRQREDDAANRGFFGGLFLGILLGVVLALIFAPKRGDETRAAVAEAAGDLRHRAMEFAGIPESESSDADLGDEAAIERDITVDEQADESGN